MLESIGRMRKITGEHVLHAVTMITLARVLTAPNWEAVAAFLILVACLVAAKFAPKVVPPNADHEPRIVSLENDIKSLRSALALKR